MNCNMRQQCLDAGSRDSEHMFKFFDRVEGGILGCDFEPARRVLGCFCAAGEGIAIPVPKIDDRCGPGCGLSRA